jgi:hypothetical protein
LASEEKRQPDPDKTPGVVLIFDKRAVTGTWRANDGAIPRSPRLPEGRHAPKQRLDRICDGLILCIIALPFVLALAALVKRIIVS